jgi:hypothetical protein
MKTYIIIALVGLTIIGLAVIATAVSAAQPRNNLYPTYPTTQSRGGMMGGNYASYGTSPFAQRSQYGYSNGGFGQGNIGCPMAGAFRQP